MKSISAKMLCLLMMLILPLNMLAIIESTNAIGAVIEQAGLMEQNIADEYMAELAARMDNMQSLLYYLATKDANCIRMQAQKDGLVHIHIICLRHQQDRNSGNETDQLPAYFYYVI